MLYVLLSNYHMILTKYSICLVNMHWYTFHVFCYCSSFHVANVCCVSIVEERGWRQLPAVFTYSPQHHPAVPLLRVMHFLLPLVIRLRTIFKNIKTSGVHLFTSTSPSGPLVTGIAFPPPSRNVIENNF